MDQVNIKIYKNVQKTYQIIPIDINNKRIFGSEMLLAEQVSVSLVPDNGSPVVNIPVEIRQQGSTIQISFSTEFARSVSWQTARYSVSISRSGSESTVLSGGLSVESIDGRMKNTMDVIQVVCDPSTLGVTSAYIPPPPTTTPTPGSNTGGTGSTGTAPILEVGKVIAGPSPSVSIRTVNGKTVMDFVLPESTGAGSDPNLSQYATQAKESSNIAGNKAADAEAAATAATEEATKAVKAAEVVSAKSSEIEKAAKQTGENVTAATKALDDAKVEVARLEALARNLKQPSEDNGGNDDYEF